MKPEASEEQELTNEIEDAKLPPTVLAERVVLNDVKDRLDHLVKKSKNSGYPVDADALDGLRLFLRVQLRRLEDIDEKLTVDEVLKEIEERLDDMAGGPAWTQKEQELESIRTWLKRRMGKV